MPFSRAVKPFLPTATLPLFRAVDKNRTILPLYQKKSRNLPAFYKKMVLRTNLHSMRRCAITNISLQVAD